MEAEEKKPFACKHCNRSFTRSGDLKLHERYHGYDTHLCSTCNKRFVCDYDLQRHLIIHLGKEDDVRKEDASPKSFVRLDDSVQLSFIACKQCNRSFTRDYDLQQHLLVHHTKQKHEVPEDEEASLGGDPNLKTYLHVDDDTTQTVFCDVCNEAVPRGFRMMRHIRAHAARDEKPLACNVCNLVFYKKTCLQRHTLVHTGERPCVCRHCGAAFSQDSTLKTHVRSAHTGERPHRCSTCGKGFTRRTKLRVHLRTHTGEKPYACAICSCRFRNSSSLKQHLRTHTGERPYSCDTCSKTFSSRDSFRTHCRRSLCKKDTG